MLSFSVNRYIVPLFIIGFIIGLSSCNSQREAKDDILRIKIPDNEAGVQLYASDFISDIEYVTLETHSQCLIGEYFNASISENYILVFGSTEANCFLFSRDGKFIRKIGQRGHGPEEYESSRYQVKIDEKSGVVFLIGDPWSIYSYRITGEFIKKLDILELFKTAGIAKSSRIIHWKDDLFCAIVDLGSGVEAYRFVIFSLDGEIIKLYSNYIHFESDQRFSTTLNSDGHIFFYNEQVYFKEMLCDTIFLINDQLDLVPEIILDLPGEKIPTSMRGQPPTNPSSLFTISNIYIYENYLFMNGNVYCLYDKNNSKLSTVKHDTSISIERNVQSYNYNTVFKGFTNDIDGGFAFFPYYRYQMQNEKQFANAFQSYELKQYLTNEYLSQRKIKNLEAHQRLKKLLSKLDEDDNPVIIIATVK